MDFIQAFLFHYLSLSLSLYFLLFLSLPLSFFLLFSLSFSLIFLCYMTFCFILLGKIVNFILSPIFLLMRTFPSLFVSFFCLIFIYLSLFHILVKHNLSIHIYCLSIYHCHSSIYVCCISIYLSINIDHLSLQSGLNA